MSEVSHVRVGMDLVEVRVVASSVAHFGDRYVTRIFTPHEVASCIGPPSVVAAGLAARFAAKEATIKVLRPTANQPDWRSMEVRRDPAGWCSMVLSGYAATLAENAGIDELSVSLTHEKTVAGAVVVALCREPATPAHVPGSHLSPTEEKREQ
jgi:holo-[acyl-carrier protein] synthase